MSGEWMKKAMLGRKRWYPSQNSRNMEVTQWFLNHRSKQHMKHLCSYATLLYYWLLIISRRQGNPFLSSGPHQTSVHVPGPVVPRRLNDLQKQTRSHDPAKVRGRDEDGT